MISKFRLVGESFIITISRLSVFRIEEILFIRKSCFLYLCFFVSFLSRKKARSISLRGPVFS